jgi:membrane protein
LNIKIKWRYRLISGTIFCLLWMIARKVFGLYILHISEVNLLYGSLSSVIVILMWVFYSSMALLFSIEVMFVLHSGNLKYRWW